MSWFYRAIFGNDDDETEKKLSPTETFDNDPLIISYGLGDLYRIDQNDNNKEQVILCSSNIYLLLKKDSNIAYKFYLEIINQDNKILLHQPVKHAMQLTFNKIDSSMKWILINQDNTIIWKYIYKNKDEENIMKLNLAKCTLETSTQMDFAKMVKNSTDEEFLLDAYNDDHMDISDDDDDDNNTNGFNDNKKSSKNSTFAIKFAQPAELSDSDDEYSESYYDSDQESEQDDLDDEKEQQDAIYSRYQNDVKKSDKNPNTAYNSLLELGKTTNRTFVFREDDQHGTMMGIFQYNPENEEKLSYVTKLDNISDLNGNKINPSATMIHQQDDQLLLLDKNTSQHKIYAMDLHRGQIVHEYQANDYIKINNIAPIDKYAQLDTESTLLAANSNMLFRIDPRLNNQDKIVMEQSYMYKSNPKLSCINTNSLGQIVAGDDNGEIRLYSHINKRAKTKLPSLGDNIIDIDVTDDGSYILATTLKYLLVIPTTIENDKKHRTGFDISINNKKPKPIKLTLNPADMIKFGIKNIKFVQLILIQVLILLKNGLLLVQVNILLHGILHKLKNVKDMHIKLKNVHIIL